MASVRQDFFLDPAYRLTEQERALMTAMLHDLVEGVARDLAAAAPAATEVADTSGLAERLSASGLLDREELVSLLLRRADEHRITGAFAGRSGQRKPPLLPRLVGDADAAVAAAAMALVVARGRRRDGFGQPRAELSDLGEGEANRLIFAVAAGLSHGGATGDLADLAAAAGRVAAGYQADESLDAVTAALAGSLEHAGQAGDAMVEAAAVDGEAGLLAALLARRAAISAETAWGFLVGGQDGGLALLARMAGLGRPAGARLIAEFAALVGASVEEEMAHFDNLTDSEVSSALDWWRLPPDLRAAAAALGEARG